MKKIKRLIFLGVAGLMLLITLASCGSKKPSPIGSYNNGTLIITETEVKSYSNKGQKNETCRVYQYKVVDSYLFFYDRKSVETVDALGNYTINYIDYTEEELERSMPRSFLYITDAGDLMYMSGSYSVIKRDK